MYWFRRPPYLRWIAAVVLVAGAAWVELRPRATELRPFAATDLAAHTVVESHHVEWRTVPARVLPEVPDPTGTLLRDVDAGEPLLPSSLATDRVAAPKGWWTMQTHLPAGVAPGQAIQLVVLPAEPGGSPQPVAGIVIEPPPPSDPLAFEPLPGLVAIPAESAVEAAAAVADRRVTVLLGD